MWPCEWPTFYGHCDDGSDPLIPGIIDVLTQEDFDAVWEVEKADRIVKLTQSLRMQRNDMLSNCDWTQLSDAPLDDVKKQAWIEYRQALRDVTSQEGFPQTIEWPKSPDAPEELAVTV
ncbi:MAG: tail fiber assembly protein [Methylococcaceae bacterium]